MPFINSKITLPIDEEEMTILKKELANICSNRLGKNEGYLMIGFEDNYKLYFKGKKLDYGAFVEVKIFGTASREAFSKVTADICELFNRILKIPGDAIYIKYEEVSNWGYNSFNF